MVLKIFVFCTLFLWSLGIKSQVYADCNFNTSEHISELSNLKSLKKLEINVLKYKKFTINTLQAVLDKKDSILPKYKKKFDAKIISHYKFGRCTHTGKVRLHGDWKDHIGFDSGSLIQSLDVTLENGSIANFIKFKLFLPETRKFENEVILTSILRSLDFLAPRTSMTKVIVNGKESNMLIQEKVVKEMLENQKRREGPLLEGEEKYHFNNFRDFQHYDLKGISLSKMTNSKWSEMSLNTANISINALLDLQTVFSQFANSNNNIYSLNWELLSKNNSTLMNKWAMYEILLFATNSSHALIPHNRKFYFNSFYSGFEPVFFDGNVRSIKGSWMRVRPNFSNYPNLNLDNFKNLESLIENIDINSFLKNYVEADGLLDYETSVTIFGDILKKIKILRNEFIEYRKLNQPVLFQDPKISIKQFSSKVNSFLQDGHVLHLNRGTEDSDNFLLKICDIVNLTCFDEEIALTQLGDLLEKKHIEGMSEESPIIILPALNTKTRNKNLIFLKGNIKVQSSLTSNVVFDKDSMELLITFTQPDDWALLYESDLSNIKVKMSSVIDKNEIKNKKTSSRIDKNGFTGCLSIFDSKFRSTKLEVKSLASSCEDSINIVKSTGNLSEIVIHDAESDALDVDFSELTIESLHVKNAGNDCADFSSGKYKLNKLYLSGCNDKAISIGENSQMSLQNAIIDGANIGISSKDSSITLIDNVSINNTNICMESYQKKQEFLGSELSVLKFNCNNSLIKKGKYSAIKYL